MEPPDAPASVTMDREHEPTRDLEPQRAVPAVRQDPSELPFAMQRGLYRQGYSRGLVRELGRYKVNAPLRFWILDNGSSMSTNDSQRLHEETNEGDTTSSPFKDIPSTRWAELQSTVTRHIQLAELLELPTVVQFLNPSSSGPQEFVLHVSDTGTSSLLSGWSMPVLTATEAMALVNSMNPHGTQQLTTRLLDVGAKLESIASTLRQRHQRAVLILCTDGLPTDEAGESATSDLIRALQSLEALPVDIVIRLCTSDRNVFDFYNNLDRRLKLSVRVMSNYLSDAKQVYDYNPWLTYGLPLHCCRELGLLHRTWDFLDKRLLGKDELARFLRLLFGNDNRQSIKADPVTDWNAFRKQVSDVVCKHPQIYHPIKRSMNYWIDLRQLKQAYRESCCLGLCCGYCDTNDVYVADDKDHGPTDSACCILECLCCLCDLGTDGS